LSGVDEVLARYFLTVSGPPLGYARAHRFKAA